MGCDPTRSSGTGPTDDGKQGFVSYWDSGFVVLDLSDPASPTLLGHTVSPANADGDGHSASFDDTRELLFTADEDFCKTSGPQTEKGFGYLRVYDYSDRGTPMQIGEY